MAEDRVERKLAAILAADVVGYSRLMDEDEAGTLARLKALRRELFEPKTKEHRGRIFKTTGDGALVEFKSAVDAVNCAVDIQHALAGREAGVPEERRMQLRIGVSLGDVIVEGTDLYGRGVNVAARLEGLAEPGGICISGNVHEHVRGAAGLVFDDLGNQEVKNIPEPVRAFGVRLGANHAVGPDLPQTGTSPPLPDKPSIAVLPFQNLSGDAAQEYFADGMVEDIITGLSRIKWLFVIARNSSFAYKGKSPDIRRVGRELGVRYVLEGSVRKLGNRVRITGQLIDAATGTHLWAERYDRNSEDIFALQDEITLSVVGAIEPSLRQAEVERVNRKRPDNLDAYDLVLQALPKVYTLMPDGASKSLPLLERALALEPDYAAALAYAAWCHEILFVRAGLHEENRLAMSRYARAALLHGRDDATALTVAGFCIGLIEHDRATAFQALDAALALSPSTAFTHICGSTLLGWAGEAEQAIAWGERGLRLSPFDPLRFLALNGITVGHFLCGRDHEAVDAARKAVQVNPLFSVSYMLLVAPLVRLGRTEEAKLAAKRLMELQPSFSIGRQCRAVGIVPSLTTALTEAVQSVGVPP